MAGALFYAARLPVEADKSTPVAETPTATVGSVGAKAPTFEVDTHPEFSMQDGQGNSHALSDWQGKSRILNFWATWCAPCRHEIPRLKAFQDEQSGNGFQVIGIAVDEVDAVNRYAEEAQFNYPVLIGQEEAMAVAEMSGIPFAALPFTMFIAADGEYVGAYLGELHDEHFATIVDVMTRLDRNEISADTARETLKAL